MMATFVVCGSALAADEDTDRAAIAAEIDPVQITFSSTYSENETNGLLPKQFETILDELSDGKMTLNIY